MSGCRRFGFDHISRPFAAQDQVFRRMDFIQPAKGCGVRSFMEDVGVCARLISDLPHRRDESV